MENINPINCNGQYFEQKCVHCGLLLKIWCTDWKACPKCGTKNYGRHFGAKSESDSILMLQDFSIEN